MTGRKSSNSNWIKEPYFKPIEDGYLFEVCNPWVFGRARSYIVTEDQKQLLSGIISPAPMAWWVALGIVALTVYAGGVGLLCWELSRHDTPNALDLLGMTVTIIVPVYVFLLVLVRRFLRRIEPIVSAARPTQAKLSITERYQAVGHAMSTKALVAGAAIWSISAIVRFATILMGRHGQSLAAPIFQAVISMILFAFYAWMLHRRFRRTR